MSDIYTYKIGKSLYINLTNACTNDCDFCVRNKHDGVDGYNLRLNKEPTAKDIIAQIPNPTEFCEVIFCGLGEPTIKIDVLKEVAQHVKNGGGKTRLNTNGHASLFHGRDIAAEIAGLIDTVSISLNASDEHKYHAICQSPYKEQAYFAMLCFASDCLKYNIRTVLSVVDIIGAEEVEACRKVAQSVGAEFRVREMIE